MLPKAEHHGEANDGDIEDQDSTDVGHTGLQGLEPLLPGCDRQHCTQDENIGEENEHSIQQQGTDDQSQGVEAVELDVRAGQPQQVLVQAERVGEDVGAAVMEELQASDDGENGQCTSHQNGPHDM